MKRLILSLIIVISLMAFSGCVKKLDNTQEQTDALAEYMAGLLLKYDANYDRALRPVLAAGEDKTDSTDKQTDKTDKEENDNADAKDASGSKSDEMGNEADNKEIDTDKQKTYSLTEIIGQADFDISYLDYNLADIYPENYSKTYFYVEADEEKQLLVIRFNVKNTSIDKKNLNLSNTDIKYQLELAGGIIDKPWFTVLENDLQYIDITMEPEAATVAVLIYQISKTADTTNMKLLVSNGDKKLLIPLN
ncbi:MAG: hypothetical protein GX757_07290 [Clostridiales bacterium]|nr:hypothetical protein [Clostridiales bacterium]